MASTTSRAGAGHINVWHWYPPPQTFSIELDSPLRLVVWWQSKTHLHLISDSDDDDDGPNTFQLRKTKKKKKKLRFHRPQNNSFPFFSILKKKKKKKKRVYSLRLFLFFFFLSAARAEDWRNWPSSILFCAQQQQQPKKGERYCSVVVVVFSSSSSSCSEGEDKRKKRTGLGVFNKTRTWIEKLEKCQGGQARPFCRALFYFRAPWWMTSSDGRVRQHIYTHTWESPAATHMAVSSSFTALANRLLFLFHSLEKKRGSQDPHL